MAYPLDWDKLRIFHACAEARSFTNAAKTLNITQSAISRQISTLEQDINIQLFARHARGLILTEQGEVLYKITKNVMRQLEDVQSILLDIKGNPKGLLRITTPFGLGANWLINKIPEFQKLYKDIQVEIKLDDAELDLARRHADCAIRLYQPLQADLIQRHLFTVHLNIYASVGYIKQNGIPQTLSDISKHQIISYGDRAPQYLQGLNWLERAIKPHKPRLQVNNLLAIKTAVKNDLGLAVLPDYMINEVDDLILLFPKEANIPSLPTYFCYHQALKNSARLRAFSEFLFASVKNWPL